MSNYEDLILRAISEDVGTGDYTSLACIPMDASGKAQLIAKEEGILAGASVALKVFELVDKDLNVTILKNDGNTIAPQEIVLEVSGNARSILKAERIALNYVQRMSGIATSTHKMVTILKGTSTKILDTRKTTPNNRIFEKEAVRIGGGRNHRFGLYDLIMIKDNHIDYAGGIAAAIHRVKEYVEQNGLDIDIEIEARNLAELKEILTSPAVDRIMLDNFSFEDLKKAVKQIDGRSKTEASGGINEQTIRQYAECGVDYISVGALTHQIKSLDLSLKAV